MTHPPKRCQLYKSRKTLGNTCEILREIDATQGVRLFYVGCEWDFVFYF